MPRQQKHEQAIRMGRWWKERIWHVLESEIKDLLDLVGAIWRAAPMIGNVFVLILFGYLFFGTVGISLFAGSFDRRCARLMPPPSSYNSSLSDAPQLCTPDNGSTQIEAAQTCPFDAYLADGAYFELVSTRLCAHPKPKSPDFQRGNAGNVCPPGQYCVRFSNPGGGMLHHDHLGGTALWIFIAVTTRKFGDVTEMLMDAVGRYASLYAIIVRLVISSLFLSLFVAVLYAEYVNSRIASRLEQWPSIRSVATFQESSHYMSSSRPRPSHSLHTDNFELAKNEWYVYSSTPPSQNSIAASASNLVPEQDGNSSDTEAQVQFSCICELCRKQLEKSKALAREAVSNNVFRWAVFSLISLDCIALASRYDGMRKEHAQAVQIINHLATAGFAIEYSLRLFAYGKRVVTTDAIYTLDAIVTALIIVLSMVNLVTQNDVVSLSSLRIIRLLSVVSRNAWPELAESLSIVFKSAAPIGRAAALLALFLCITGSIGHLFFHDELVFCDHFVVDDAFHRDGACYVECSSEQAGKYVRFGREIDAPGGLCMQTHSGSFQAKLGMPRVPRLNFRSVWEAMFSLLVALQVEGSGELTIDLVNRFGPAAMIYVVITFGVGSFVVITLFLVLVLHAFSLGRTAMNDLKRSAMSRNIGVSQSKVSRLGQRSLFIFGPSNPFRVAVRNAVENPGFERAVLSLVVLNCIIIAIADATFITTSATQTISWIERTLAVVFAIEILLKGIAFTFFTPPEGFLRSGWSILDTTVVFVSLGSWIVGEVASEALSLGAITSLRALRSLRILRVAGRFPQLRRVVDALMRALGRVADVGVVALATLIMFGALGLSIFSGRERACYIAMGGLEPNSPPLTASQLNVRTIDRSWCERSPHLMLVPSIDEAKKTNFSLNNLMEWRDGETVAVESGFNCRRIEANETVARVNAEHNRLEVFGGLRWNCSVERGNARDVYGKPVYLLSYEEPQILEHEWREPSSLFGFHNIGTSILTLFALDRKRIFQYIDIAGEDLQPERNAAKQNAVFFTAYIIATQIFIFNLFVAVTVTEFDRSRQAIDAGGVDMFNLSFLQKRWLNILRLSSFLSPQLGFQSPPTEQRFRNTLYKIATSRYFEEAVLFFILCNVILLASRHRDMSPSHEHALFVLDCMFTAIFTLEALIKAVSFGFVRYIRDPWDMLDGTVVILSIAGLIVAGITGAETTFASIGRIVRALRLSFFVPRMKGLKQTTLALRYSIPGVMSVLLVCILLSLVFAVFASSLFGRLRRVGEITARHNFDTALDSCFTLYRIAIGERWAEFANDIVTTRKACIQVLTSEASEHLDTPVGDYAPAPPPRTLEAGKDYLNRCPPPAAVVAIFFVSYTVLLVYIVLRPLIAILMQSMRRVEPSLVNVTYDHILQFQDVWAHYDPDGTSYAPVGACLHIIAAVGRPIGAYGETRESASEILLTSAIPMRGDKVHIIETFLALCERKFAVVLPAYADKTAKDKLQDKLPKERGKDGNNEGVKASVKAHFARQFVSAAITGLAQRRWASLQSDITGTKPG